MVADIQDKLQFRQPNLFRKSFSRDNLAYVVLYEEGKENKLLDILRKVNGSGIVYVRNRRRTREIAILLQRNGIRADYYHAGLETQTRSQKQDDWLAGRIRVMVCTNAFGMGIDKADVRTVVHMELPDSLEAYFQELQYELSYPPMDDIRRVYRALGSRYQLALGAGQGQSFDFDIVSFTENYQLELVKTFHALRILEQAGWIALTDAVFHPAGLMIRVSKDELYDYQLRHPKLDKVLKAVLRTYQGAFSQHLHLREAQLANFLKMPKAELQQAFQKLQQDGIIDYRPPKDKPQLVFLRERADADNLTIDRQRFHFRKTRHLDRIQAAIRYAESNICRARQLLAYFGEPDAAACGICDVCTGRNKTDLSGEDYEKLKKKSGSCCSVTY